MAALRPLSLVVIVLALLGCGRARREGPPATHTLGVAEALGGSERNGFERAVEPRPFDFPRDHGPHARFRTEWWYFTGNLLDLDGRHFGFQATFFRNGLDALAAERSSSWAAREIFMAHFALTDSSAKSFRSFERFGRGAAGIAGAVADPLRIWLEDWEVSQLPVVSELVVQTHPNARLPPLRLRLTEEDIALDLTLVPVKPEVLHGERGLSRKGSQPGNASYYYSFTRLQSEGTLNVGGRTFAVDGLSWMDHEWSTSVLEEGLVGWNWVSLQFPDRSELMYFELRNADGEIDEVSGTTGTWIEPDGSHEPLAPGDATLTPLSTWTSKETAISYPSRWRLTINSRDLVLEFEPTVAQQEHAGAITYWEGAVSGALGTSGEEAKTFRGYVELTGYGDRAPTPRVARAIP
ncbi:MAG: carotenoid 1,2-hydratase [Acidobacteriota bacterium]|nr:carotenoid 1,2-hydratase [Acidobacteriota bacterium]